MADFKAGDFLSGDITATDVEKLKKKELILLAKELDANIQVGGIPKADVKAVVLQALTERSMLKSRVKPVEITEMQFQLEMKKLEMQEREKRQETERQEREAENRESMLREKQKSRDSLR